MTCSFCRKPREWLSNWISEEGIPGDGVHLHCLVNQHAQLDAEVQRLREALAEISKGEGPFSPDRLCHAENIITAMKDIAHSALAGQPGKEKP